VSDTKCRLPDEEQAEREKLKTIVRAMLEAADKTGELHEKVLATLPPMLADQLRAAWAGRSGWDLGCVKTRRCSIVIKEFIRPRPSLTRKRIQLGDRTEKYHSSSRFYF
jgi:hypothetical protein